MTMQWKNGRQLSQVKTSKDTITYKYNIKGLRTRKYNSDYTYYYYYDDNNNLIAMMQGGVVAYFYYDSNNSVTAMSINDSMYYYIKNLQGDITKIVNHQGKVMVEYTYDAWGNILKEKSNVTPSYATVKEFNPFRYRGYVYDTDTGLYYLQSRYYDPKTGRFINADDTAYVDTNSGTPLSTNMFAYCENNHICRNDASGNFWSKLISIVWSKGRLRAFTVAIAIDAIMFMIAGALKATWSCFMAPLKFMGKKAAARFFARKIVPKIKCITNKIVKIGVKALIWIGKKAFAGLFNLKAKMAISAILNEPMRVVSACTSIGGFIAAIWDYFSDKRFDGWIKIC